MTKKTVFLMRLVIVLFIMIVIPYIQNAWAGPVSAGISFFMWYYPIAIFPQAYLYIITMWMVEWVVVTLFVQSRLDDTRSDEPTKFELNQ